MTVGRFHSSEEDRILELELASAAVRVTTVSTTGALSVLRPLKREALLTDKLRAAMASILRRSREDNHRHRLRDRVSPVPQSHILRIKAITNVHEITCFMRPLTASALTSDLDCVVLSRVHKCREAE